MRDGHVNVLRMIVQGISEMSVPAFANGGMNVTGLRLVDFTDPTVKSYVQDWSVVNRNVKNVASPSHNKVIQVRGPEKEIGEQRIKMKGHRKMSKNLRVEYLAPSLPCCGRKRRRRARKGQGMGRRREEGGISQSNPKSMAY